jgi:hypothetical protein
VVFVATSSKKRAELVIVQKAHRLHELISPNHIGLNLESVSCIRIFIVCVVSGKRVSLLMVYGKWRR